MIENDEFIKYETDECSTPFHLNVTMHDAHHCVCGNHIYRNVPPPGEKLTERYQQADRISSKVCTSCMQLASFFKDDMSPWVLYSIHIQRSHPSFPKPTFQPPIPTHVT